MKTTWAALAALALALAGCGPGVELDGLADGGRARVVAVPAGDLVALADGRRIRLAGVESPHADEAHAEPSRATLSRLALGREVDLYYDAAGGEGSAQLRTAEGRVWLQGALLEAGAARVRPRARERAMAAAMLNAEARARRAKRGLWALDAYRVALPAELGPDAGGLQLVEGRIRHVELSGGRLHLDFGDDPLAFSVEAPARAETEFALAGRPVSALVGKLVRVRGPVEGATMRIEGPEAVELLKP